MAPGLTVCLSFDFDAVSIWLTSFRSRSPSAISRGEYGARVGVPRILDLLARHSVAATFFVPGQTAELYPHQVGAIHAAGHELAVHGYRHERQVALGRDVEREVIRRGAEILADLVGERPTGFRSPAWELSFDSVTLLVELGFTYDSSMMADDFRPYRCRAGDCVSDDGQLVPGAETGLWELPVAWELDDFPYFFFSSYPYYDGSRSPDDVYGIWRSELDYAHRTAQGGVFTLTTHPQIIGRGPRIEMLDRFIQHATSLAGVRFGRMTDVVRELSAGVGLAAGGWEPATDERAAE